MARGTSAISQKKPKVTKGNKLAAQGRMLKEATPTQGDALNLSIFKEMGFTESELPSWATTLKSATQDELLKGFAGEMVHMFDVIQRLNGEMELVGGFDGDYLFTEWLRHIAILAAKSKRLAFIDHPEGRVFLGLDDPEGYTGPAGEVTESGEPIRVFYALGEYGKRPEKTKKGDDDPYMRCRNMMVAIGLRLIKDINEGRRKPKGSYQLGGQASVGDEVAVEPRPMLRTEIPMDADGHFAQRYQLRTQSVNYAECHWGNKRLAQPAWNEALMRAKVREIVGEAIIGPLREVESPNGFIQVGTNLYLKEEDMGMLIFTRKGKDKVYRKIGDDVSERLRQLARWIMYLRAQDSLREIHSGSKMSGSPKYMQTRYNVLAQEWSHTDYALGLTDRVYEECIDWPKYQVRYNLDGTPKESPRSLIMGYQEVIPLGRTRYEESVLPWIDGVGHVNSRLGSHQSTFDPNIMVFREKAVIEGNKLAGSGTPYMGAQVPIVEFSREDWSIALRAIQEAEDVYEYYASNLPAGNARHKVYKDTGYFRHYKPEGPCTLSIRTAAEPQLTRVGSAYWKAELKRLEHLLSYENERWKPFTRDAIPAVKELVVMATKKEKKDKAEKKAKAARRVVKQYSAEWIAQFYQEA